MSPVPTIARPACSLSVLFMKCSPRAPCLRIFIFARFLCASLGSFTLNSNLVDGQCGDGDRDIYVGNCPLHVRAQVSHSAELRKAPQNHKILFFGMLYLGAIIMSIIGGFE
jgi:hypothetical protein